VTTAGPGSGPGGAPTAIALSPILSARYRARDLERIRAAAPGARLVTVSIEGLADGPLDDVEVMLRGWLNSDAFDRLLARAPRLAWVHSATSGVERALTPASRERGLIVTNARGVFSRPIAEYVLMMILAVSRRLPQLLELQRERTWQPLEGSELRDVTVGIVGLGSIGRAVGGLATAFGCRVIAVRRRPESGVESSREGDDLSFGEAMLDRVGGPEMLPELLGDSMPQLDYPVLGGVLLAVGCWELTGEPDETQRHAAVRLVALGQRFGYHRTLPTLAWTNVHAVVDAVVPDVLDKLVGEYAGQQAVDLRGEALDAVAALG